MIVSLRSRLALFICMALAGSTGLFAQTLFFRAEQVTVGQSAASGGNCLQLAVIMDTSGVGTDEAWQQFTINMDYVDADGITTGPPTVRMTNNVGANNGPEAAITNPGTAVDSGNCNAGNIINSATLGGTALNFTPGANATSTGGMPNAITSIASGHITLNQLEISGDLFLTSDGVETVLAVVEFPLVASPALGSSIELNFTPGGDNIINRIGRESLDAVTTDGYGLVFSPLDCSGATAADNLGSATGSSIEINYLDVQAGGVGGNITLTMPHATTDPTSIRIVGSDGSDITLTGGDIGSGSTTTTLTTQADSTPATNVDAVTYTITYGVDNPLGGTSFGEACTVTVTWAQPSCTVASDPVNPPSGATTDFDVTLTNASWDGTRFGVFTRPDSTTVDLVTPSSVSGNVLNFDSVITIDPISSTDAGTYSVDSAGPGDANTTSCDVLIAFNCPTNTSSVAGPVDIEGMATVTLAGNDVTSWDVTYNGATQNLPTGTATAMVGPLVGDATTITVVANGQDVNGPCPATETLTLDFSDPVCGAATQDPDSTTTPVDVGTVITLSLVTTGAVDAAIGGVSMTPDVDADDNVTVTWTATHTAVADETITATITNPDGTTADCSWVIDINCIEPTLVLPLPPIGDTGITIMGTPDCTYTVFIVGPDGSETTIDITVGPDGTGTDTTVVIEPDTTYSVGQQGLPNPGGQATTVPTLGEWGLIAFITLLMASGVVFMRRRRLA